MPDEVEPEGELEPDPESEPDEPDLDDRAMAVTGASGGQPAYNMHVHVQLQNAVVCMCTCNSRACVLRLLAQIVHVAAMWP